MLASLNDVWLRRNMPPKRSEEDASQELARFKTAVSQGGVLGIPPSVPWPKMAGDFEMPADPVARISSNIKVFSGNYVSMLAGAALLASLVHHPRRTAFGLALNGAAFASDAAAEQLAEQLHKMASAWRGLTPTWLRYASALGGQGFIVLLAVLSRRGRRGLFLGSLLVLAHAVFRKGRVQRDLKRAKTACVLFNSNAGQNAIQGAAVDQHGNAEEGLGRKGAYTGMRIVILQEYGFDCKPVVESLKGFGFEVQLMGPSDMPTAESLDATLGEISQLWLISSNERVLTDAHFPVIQKHWEKGLGLYVFGDNSPYFVDANRLLTPISGSLGVSPPLQLEGNSRGGKYADVMKDGQTKGIKPHLLTTGLVKLFEGETLSSLPKESASRAGLEEILIDHDGYLIVAALSRTDSHGPMIVDGGFTKLFCSWKEGGSGHFVGNCACWLSADTRV